MLASTRGRVIEAAAIGAVQRLGYVGMNPEKLQVVSGIIFFDEMSSLCCLLASVRACALYGTETKTFLGIGVGLEAPHFTTWVVSAVLK